MGDDVSMCQLNDDECNAPFDWCDQAVGIDLSCVGDVCSKVCLCVVLSYLVVYVHISYSCQCSCSYIVWVASVGAILAETGSWARFPAVPLDDHTTLQHSSAAASAEAPHPFYGYYGPVSQFRVYFVQKDDSNSCMMLHAMCRFFSAQESLGGGFNCPFSPYLSNCNHSQSN